MPVKAFSFEAMGRTLTTAYVKKRLNYNILCHCQDIVFRDLRYTRYWGRIYIDGAPLMNGRGAESRYGRVAELVDAAVSKTVAPYGMWVRIPPRLPRGDPQWVAPFFDPQDIAPSAPFRQAFYVLLIDDCKRSIIRHYQRMPGQRGRPKNNPPTKKVEPTIPADAYARLVELSKIPGYGNSPTEVARYLILREIDDLTRAGVLRPPES